MNAPLKLRDATACAAPRIPAALSEAIAYALRRAQEASFDAYLRRVGNLDLKPGRYALLMVLDANPGVTPTMLARVAGRDKSSVTPALRDLEVRGFVMRTRTQNDRRSYGIALTPRGRDLLAELRRHARAHDTSLDAIVGTDRAHLMAVLGRLTRALYTPAMAGSQ